MTARFPSSPFVLFDDARVGATSPARLYRDPLEIVSTDDPADVARLIDHVGGAQGHWAGFMGYEAGLALEPRLTHRIRRSDLPLLWFARFDGYEAIPAGELAAQLPAPDGGWLGTPRPRIARAGYDAAHARVQSLISAGDIYQANLTIRADVSTAGHPLALYAGLRARAQAGFGGVIWTGDDWLLSLSPELFFALHDGKVTTKPMKGTATRGADAAEDAAIVAQLQRDPKQRAENLMIVDLLRNDLSRVAEPGSVRVPHLFTVESYPTVHQMISTVAAQLEAGKSVADLLAAIYPCGSITGAPKIRAMEIIDELEPVKRGIYGGACGYLSFAGDMDVAIAIRTGIVQNNTLYVQAAAGVVADSVPEMEWRETEHKARALIRAAELVEEGF